MYNFFRFLVQKLMYIKVPFPTIWMPKVIQEIQRFCRMHVQALKPPKTRSQKRIVFLFFRYAHDLLHTGKFAHEIGMFLCVYGNYTLSPITKIVKCSYFSQFFSQIWLTHFLFPTIPHNLTERLKRLDFFGQTRTNPVFQDFKPSIHSFPTSLYRRYPKCSEKCILRACKEMF